MNSSLLIIVALIGAVYCKEIEMPSYDVLSTDGPFEIRRYSATKWVSTTFQVIHLNFRSKNHLYFLFL